jgi:hypothetical protein
MIRFVLAVLVLGSGSFADSPKGNHVTFRDDGVFLVNSKPFFPIGIWVYDAAPGTLDDCKAKGFNTIVGNGFSPKDLDAIGARGMYALPFATEEFLSSSVNHPALLAWYVTDEPEGHGLAPEQVKESYDELKKKDPNHPAGLCHFLFDAFDKYKNAVDFTMSDVYPVTANRDVPLRNVGIHLDQARAVQKKAGHPIIPFIQDFGGTDTDGGKWAQPEYEEVRCMTVIGLVHRPSAVFVFSYWAKYPKMWNKLTVLNSDIKRLTPWLLTPGEEVAATSSDPAIEVRAKRIGEKWMIMAVNTERKAVDAKLTVEGLGDADLVLPFENGKKKASSDVIDATFKAIQEHVYLVGTNPKL